MADDGVRFQLTAQDKASDVLVRVAGGKVEYVYVYGERHNTYSFETPEQAWQSADDYDRWYSGYYGVHMPISVFRVVTERTPVERPGPVWIAAADPEELDGLPDDTPLRINGKEKTLGEYGKLRVGGTRLPFVMVALGHLVEYQRTT